MAPHARQRHDVRLQSRAAARIGSGEDEHDGRKIGHEEGVAARAAVDAGEYARRID
jgi:hypothetical protein